MKYIATILTITLSTILIACGGSSDSIAAKKASLEQLKKQALDINAKITLLENELNWMKNKHYILL